VFVPFFAFLLSLAYIRRRFYYIDHLVFSLHFHTFVFVLMILLVIKGALLPDLLPGAALGWILFVLLSAYLLVAMKRVYGQGWGRTTLKFVLVGWVYFIVMALALTFTTFYGLTNLAA
jgi:hypothetical protein